MDVNLNQRGRSSIDFLVSLASHGGSLSEKITQDIQAANLNESSLEEDYSARETSILEALKTSKAFQLEMLIHEWLSTNHGLVTIDAFEEIRSTVEPVLESLAEGTCQLTLDPTCDIPDYWRNFEIHRTTGGWDGHEHMGFIHRELIHKRYVSAKYPWKILSQRKQVLEELPKDKTFENIFEMGCGTGLFTHALAEKFPNASISACDLSPTLLREAQRLANENHWSWHLQQAPAENTGLTGETFDLVTSYILLHELPASSVEAIFKEAFRLLKPGGTIMMSDARPLSDMDKLTQWKTLHRAKFGGEPFWEESTSLHLPTMLKSIGFTHIQSFGLDETKYPWLTIGLKP